MKEIFSEVFLHMALFIIFLMVFFFFFVIWIQKKAMIRDFADMIRYIESELDTGNIDFSKVSFNSPTSIQTQIDQSNQKTLTLVATVIPTAVISLVAAAYLIAPHCFWHNAVNALFALPFIAVAEFTIVGAFMYNYIVVDSATIAQVVSNFTGKNPTGDCGYMYKFMSSVLPSWLLGLIGISPDTGEFRQNSSQ